MHEVVYALTTGEARPPWCRSHAHPAASCGTAVRPARTARRSEDEMARWQRGNLATTTRTRPLPPPTATVTANTSLPTCCPAARLAAGSANPGSPGTSLLWPGIQAYRTSTSGTDLHFVRSTITTATRWWRVNKLARHRNVDGAKSDSSRAWPGLVRSAQVARLPCCRGDGVTGDALSILRACLLGRPAPETANNHTHRHLCITKYGLESSSKQSEF